MDILMITQRVDRGHDVLGFTVDWITELAANVDELYVLTAFEGEHDLPSNVTVASYGKERGLSKTRRILEFQRITARLLRRGVDGVFAHMIPQYVLASWPATRLSGIPIILWYAHGSVPVDLRVAYWLTDRVVTPTPASFNYRTGKVSVLGHGIDTKRFAPQSGVTDRKRIISVGRISPIKNTHVLIKAIQLLKQKFPGITLRIVAGESRSNDEYYDQIKSMISQRELNDTVELVGQVPHTKIAREYQSAGVFVSASDTGSLDKTEIESMACGTPVVSSNESYKNMVDDAEVDSTHLSYANGDHHELAEQVGEIIGYPDERYKAVIDDGRRLVEQTHSVSSLMKSLAAEFDSFTE